MKCLNLGCGSRFHPDWTNIDFVSTGEGVIAHNLTQGIPLPDSSFDVVYHSHVLEHFSKTAAIDFLQECYRVLKPEGVLRVAVPDLEQITKTYLIALDKASQQEKNWQENYDWILLEMYDQTVRNFSGGEMRKFFCRDNITNQDFLWQRCGIEAKKLIELGQKLNKQSNSIPQPTFKQTIRKIYRLFRFPGNIKELCLKMLLGEKDYQNLQIGRFRQSGEIHQWMYDRYSLSKILQQCGFQAIVQRSATESYIKDWSSFNLDTEPDGKLYKPDSLYMEGLKKAGKSITHR